MEDYHALTDDKLVCLYAEGNNDAFDAILERHQNRIFAYILNIVKDKELADDLFQETFVKAIITIKEGRYVESGKFASWLSRIAHNLVIDHYRQESSITQISCDNADVNILNRKDLCQETVEDSMVRSQVLSDVKDLVQALPQVQKEVLEMRYYKDMSFKEIATVTGVSINTALGRMRYAIINLRKIAEEKNIVLTF